MVWDSQFILRPVYTAKYKLALAKSIASHWTTGAFAICLCRDWTLCSCGYWPSTPPEGVQGGERHSVLQGIWWDRSSDSWMFCSFSSVAQSFPNLCDHIDCSMRGFPVHHQLLELTQTHVHWVGDATQPSHPLLSPFPPAFNLSQHQSLQMNHFFTSDGQSIGVSALASVLPMNIQDRFPLGLTGWISFQSKGLSRDFSNTTFQKHQFWPCAPCSLSLTRRRRPVSSPARRAAAPQKCFVYPQSFARWG